MTTVETIVNKIETFAPKHLAEDWDPIGLSIGSFNKKVKKVMIALDLDADTIKEAKDKQVDLLFTHHPAIFRPLSNINEMDTRQKHYIDLIRANISLYSAHTNIDAAENGMNDWLAEALNFKKPYEILDTSYQSELKLLVLYTPLEDAIAMRGHLHQIGVGQVGDYKNVSYTSTGMGHFTPESEANPTIGEQNKAEEVEEERTEFLFPSHLLGKVIQTIYTKHPYEEPVYQIIDIGKKDQTYGIGRVGELEKPVSLDEMIDRVKNAFDRPNIRYANMEIKKPIQRVAILGGSGEKYYKQALSKGADLYITGDISYHGAQDMIREGLPFIDAGHFIENIFVDKMTKIMEKWNEEENWEIEVISATSQKDVFGFK